MSLPRRAILPALFLALAPGAAADVLVYVDDDAAPGGDGSGWDRPLRFLQDAITAAGSRTEPVEIRVAQGTYRPDRRAGRPEGDGDSGATFELRSGLVILGGFAGVTEPDPARRDPERFETILSGDLDGDDGSCEVPGGEGVPPCRDDNSAAVVSATATDATAGLDGVVVSGAFGAGVALLVSDAVFVGCRFRDNVAPDSGGGVASMLGSPTLVDCAFSDNLAEGIFLGGGGGFYGQGGRPTLDGCRFERNVGTIFGGGAHLVGCAATLIDCEFDDNTAQFGGGLSTRLGDPVVTGCRFTAHRSVPADEFHPGNGGGAYSFNGSPTFDGCVF
ncbi:MAG: right-handed parallel beta-helix repeat-containing protein, partial [Planctomycetota bacterium]